MKYLNIGIIGCGGAAFCIHLPVLYRLSNIFKVIMVYDVHLERAKYISNRFDGIKACTTLDEIFQNRDIDAVAILSHNQEELIEKALSTRKHVFTEKPISLDISRSKLLVKKAKDLGLILEVGLMRLYDATVTKFCNTLSVENVVSGFLYKSDGSDRLIRQTIMPIYLIVYHMLNLKF